MNLGLSKNTAIELDRDVRSRLRAGETILSVKAHIAKRLKRTGCDLPPHKGYAGPTVGDIISVHQSAYFNANNQSTRTYRRSLLNMVETVVRHRHGLPPINRAGRRVTPADYRDILDLTVSILDDTCIAEFRACRMRGVPRGTAAELSAQGSVNAEVQFAKAMFSKEAMTAYKSANLAALDLSSFLKARAFPRQRKTCIPPSDTLIVGLHSAFAQLAAGDDEALFITIALALHAGLRRKEILNARRDWLQATCGTSIKVTIGDEFMPKNRRERDVPIPEWLYKRLGAAPGGHLLGDNRPERQEVYRRALAWLGDHGLMDVEKKLHFLRGLYAGFLLSDLNNIFEVKRRLGHADIETTLSYYAENPYAKPIAALWRMVLTCMPAHHLQPPRDSGDMPGDGSSNVSRAGLIQSSGAGFDAATNCCVTPRSASKNLRAFHSHGAYWKEDAPLNYEI